MSLTRHVAAGLICAALATIAPGALAQFSRGSQGATPRPSTPAATPGIASVAPSRAPSAQSSPHPESILRDSRLTDILRLQTLLRENPRDDATRQGLIGAAVSADRRSVIVIGVGARQPIRFMQKRAASVDCARWFAYHQAWHKGEKKDFGSIQANVTGTFTALLEELLPDGRLAVVRQYEFSE